MADQVRMAKQLLRMAMKPSKGGGKAVGSGSEGNASQKDEWQVHTAKNGRKFWYNRRTKKSQWNDPHDAKNVVWTAHTSKSGKTFYYNKLTKKSTWSKPENFPYADKSGSGTTKTADTKKSAGKGASVSILAAAASKVTAAAAVGGDHTTNAKGRRSIIDIASIARLKLRARRAKKCVIKRRVVLSKTKTRDGQYTITKNDDGGTDIFKNELQGGWKDFCSGHTLDDDDSWWEILRKHRKAGTKFTDTQFPPNENSIYMSDVERRATGQKTSKEDKKGLDKVAQWKRISDIYAPKKNYVKVTFCEGRTEIVGFWSHANKTEYVSCQELSSNKKVSLAEGKKLEKVAQDAIEAVCSNDFESAKSSMNDNTAKWLMDNRDGVYRKLVTGMEPAVRSSFGKTRVSYESKPGYVPMIRLYIEINYHARISLFERETEDGNFCEPGDVVQGSLGDCYFLGALATASTHEDILFDMFPDLPSDLVKANHVKDVPANEQEFNDEGVYAVKFYRDGKWRIVVVDDYLPCDKDGTLCFAKPGPGGAELWAMLAEKAYAKLAGSFEAIIGGQESTALRDITKGMPMRLKISSSNPSSCDQRFKGSSGDDELWTELVNHQTEEEIDLMGCSTSLATADAAGIITGHAYSLLETKVVRVDGGRAERLVKIRNPWGEGKEWSGRWSDESKAWDSISVTERRQMGHSEGAVEDGTFWMNLSDLRKYFETIDICRILVPSKWYSNHAVGEMFEDTAGGQNSSRNPQYQIIAPKGAHIFVSISRPFKKITGDETIGIKAESWPGGSRGKRKMDIGTVADHRLGCEITKNDNIYLELKLPPSRDPVVLIPVTNVPGAAIKYFLTVYTERPCEFLHIPDGSSGFAVEMEVQGVPLRASSGNSGGCYPNNQSWVINPQHRFEVASQTGAKITLQLSNNGYRDELAQSRKGQGAGPPSIGLCIFDMGEMGSIGGLHCYDFPDKASEEGVKTSQYINSEVVTLECSLATGKYAVVPYTFKPNTDLDYSLKLLCDAPGAISGDLSPAIPWPSELRLKGRWSKGGELAGGCINNRDTYLQNPWAELELSDGCDGIVRIYIKPTDGKRSTPMGVSVIDGSAPKPTDQRAKFREGLVWCQNSARVQGLEDGKITIMASTFEAGTEGAFELVIVAQKGRIRLGKSKGLRK